MEKIKNIPAPLRKKMLFTILLGAVCLLVGIVMFFLSHDRVMLFLSAAICVFSLSRAWSMYRLISRQEYETVEGICVGIVPKPLRKYRKVRIMDDEGTESALLLSKHSKIRIGFRYRFYFKKTQRLTIGSEYFDASLSSDCFLGYEELGEFQAEDSNEK